MPVTLLKRKADRRFWIGILSIAGFIYVGPFISKTLVPLEMKEVIDEKGIDVGNLYYTESKLAGEVEFKVKKKNIPAR